MVELAWYKKRGLLHLHKRNEAILSLHLSEKTHAEIAGKFGISRTRIDQIVAKQLRMDKCLSRAIARYFVDSL